MLKERKKEREKKGRKRKEGKEEGRKEGRKGRGGREKSTRSEIKTELGELKE